MYIKSFPHEFQMDAKDCGPACLKIIAKYYGKYYSLQYLRDLCGITKEGVSLLDISYAAEKIGLRTIAIQVGLQDVIDRITLPVIVHWNNDHFIVIYKATKNRIYVSDPAKGLLSYSHEQFKEKWYKEENTYGILMALEPMANFKQIEAHERIERFKTFENLLGYFTPYKKAFGILFFIMFVATILQAFLPFISKAVIDTGIHTGDITFIHMVLVANIVLLLSITLSNVLRDWVLLHVTTRVNISLISDYLIKLMKLPVSFFENKLVGDILQRAYDHERIRSFVMNNSLGMVFSSITFVIFSIILLIFNQTIFYIFIAGSVVYVSWVLLFLNIRKKLDWEYFELMSKDRSYWVETIENIQEIKINNYEDTKRWKWEGIQARLYRLNVKILNINNAQTLGSQFISGMQNMAVTFFCAIAVINGEITFGIMISTQFIIGMLNGPVAQFVGFVQSLQYAKISFMRINEIHQLKDEDDTSPVISNNIELPKEKGLNVRNLSFQYSHNAPIVLRSIYLTIPEGKVTAIVGDSGQERSRIASISQADLQTLQLGRMNAENAVENTFLNLQKATNRFLSFFQLEKNIRVHLQLPDPPKELLMSTEEALQLMKENNPDILSYRHQILESEMNVEQTRKNAGFNANLSAGVGFNQAGNRLNEAYIDPSRQDMISATISIPLVDWGIRKGRVNMAKNNLSITQLTVKQSEQDLEQELITLMAEFHL